MNKMIISALFSVVALTAAAETLPASAQSPLSKTQPKVSWETLGHGMMMGPGMMDRSEFSRMCRSGAAGFAEWRFDRLDEILKPTDAQRAKFDDYKTASTKAGATMRSACPTEVPTSMVQHMRAMEKLTDAKALAIKTVLPTLETFYDSLTSDQKAKLDSSEGRSRFWRGFERV